MQRARFSLLLVAALSTPGAEVVAQEATASAVRGIIRAEASATISSELVARIAEMPFKVGQPFRKGDVLLRFDCSRYEAELKAVMADVKAQQIAVDNQRQLIRHRATGANDLALSEAKWEQAFSNADALRVRLGQCQLRAPYDGHVVDRMADVFEIPQASTPLIKVVKSGDLELDLIVPSHWSVRLQPGDMLRFKIDETASSHDAQILQLGAVVDPVSRTMKLSARLFSAPEAARPGMSGTSHFSISAQGAR